jgi:hypothetical protein
VIGISVINSLKLVGFPVLGVIIFNIIICISAVLLERFTAKHNIVKYSITYENIELLRSVKNQKLLKDLSDLTGKEITRVKIRNINYKKQVALLDIYYKE